MKPALRDNHRLIFKKRDESLDACVHVCMRAEFKHLSSGSVFVGKQGYFKKVIQQKKKFVLRLK